MLFIVAFAALLCAAMAEAQPASLIVENARIYTLNPARPMARALAVRDGRILAMDGDANRFAGPATRRIDARGAAVIPGLIDSHAHLLGLGELLESGDLRHVKTVAAIVEEVRKRAAERPAAEWIKGRNWDQTNWGGQFPSSADLDKALPEHPVFLARVDGHAAWVNSRALQLAGITAATPDPAGGKILRDAQGRATGILIDRAMGLVGGKLPPPTNAQVKRQLKLAAEACARLGLTTIHDAGVTRQTLEAYRELIRDGELPVRVYAMIGGRSELWREYRNRGPEIGEQLTVRSVKLMADGALGSRGAAMWQGYTDEKSNTGLLMMSAEQIGIVAREAITAGFQVCTHAIGDRANRAVLDAYAAALGGKNDRRFRVEHAQVVSLPDFALFAANSVIASIQSTHATSDMRWAEARLGPDRIAGAYAWQRFLQLGIPIANGSDFPVEEPDPLPGFYAAVTRQDVSGNPPGGWMPSQRMTREQALASWTMGGAYAGFEEKQKGSIEPGKMADFVMLSKDIMTVPVSDILAAKATLTVMGGKVVYERP